MMPYPINQIDGLDAEELRKLRSLGIRTTDRLLEEARTARGRSLLADKTGFDKARILAWAVGVDTVRELRYRNPANLAKAMSEANKKRKLVRFLPSEKLIMRWVEQAKALTSKITYR
jgi:hypothetical protein